MKINQEQFKKMQEFITRKTGIEFESKKLFFIKRRIEKLAEELNISDFDEYFRHINFYDFDGRILQKLINEITTNETYFFREFEQLQVFAESCLQELIEYRRKYNRRKLKIWSAACSTGEEVYTLAIICLEMLEDAEDWQIEIHGTDIDMNVLAMARKGVYTERSVKFIPPAYYKKYIFQSGCDFKVVSKLKKLVSFDHLNFVDYEKLSTWMNFDFIFCRNALIYFSDIDRKKVVENFYKSLVPGGYLFLGHSESIGRITNLFKMERRGNHILYRKPE